MLVKNKAPKCILYNSVDVFRSKFEFYICLTHYLNTKTVLFDIEMLKGKLNLFKHLQLQKHNIIK